MTEEEFLDIVQKDVRGEATDNDLDILESDLSEWRQNLNDLARDVEVQLAAQRARIRRKYAGYNRGEGTEQDWLDFRAEEDRWRVGAIRFKVSVEARIMHVKSLISEKNNKTSAVS